ncbi:MAG: hypothetical protein ISQ06_14020, partial [Planctomycetaceae bacterium]|nr:hypothetical protein [Planctomycetaceae bacterium]
NMLRMDLDHYKDTKNWAELRATTDAVITLQPHYIEVWRFLSWNMAYNVSAEWDAVPDRYYWVKEGGKFSQEGTRRNADIPELYWETGRVWGQKVGRSDEWKYFRKYFLSDPNVEKFGGGVDFEVNPKQKDNYLVAKDWYTDANTAEDARVQHIMMRALFRSYPTRSQLDYADALQREGKFDSRTVQAWEQGFDEWTQGYGKMTFKAPECVLYMEANEDDVRLMAEDNKVDERVVHRWLNHYQHTTNYRYWRSRSHSESQPETGEAHKLIYEGEQLYKQGELAEALPMLQRGMGLYSTIIEKHPELADEDLTAEEGLWAVMLWQKILELQEKPIPETYALKSLWERHQGLLPELEDRFNRLGL